MSDVLLVDRDGAVATLTMNRPESLNSLSVELKVALRDALADVAADPTVRAVVLTGNGRGFCVGQDLAEHMKLLSADDPAPLRTVEEHYNPIVKSIIQMPKPVIAAVNGVAAGAGASFAFACDMRIVSETAQFVLSFANAGLGLDSGASWTLPRLIGMARALEMGLLAEPVPAKTMFEWGAINQLTAIGEVVNVAQKIAARFAEGPAQAYAAIKHAYHFATSHNAAESLDFEGKLQVEVGKSEDHKIAVSAFVNKEKPTFVGRPSDRVWM